MTFEEWKPEATKQYFNQDELPSIPNFLLWCWNTVSAAERKRWQAEVARLREVLTCAERQTIGHVPEKREHCYICSHVGSEEAIRHDGDCPFAALTTPADSWLSRHDAEVRGEALSQVEAILDDYGVYCSAGWDELRELVEAAYE